MSKNSATSNPYLTFAGNCREAISFYKSVFNAELELMTMKESPMEVPAEQEDKIIHSVLRFGDAVIMASDGMPGQKIRQANGFSILVALPTVEEARVAFNKLSEGGSVIMPFDNTFWNSMFGYCTDRFGVFWMISCENL